MSDVIIKPAPWQSNFYHARDVVQRCVSQQPGAPLVQNMEFNKHRVMIRHWWTGSEALPQATRERLVREGGGHVHIDANGDLLEI